MKGCEDKKGLEQDKCIIEKLAYYEYNINGDTFRNNFVKVGGEERMAEHLWEKFHDKKHSILALWGQLDKQNKEIVAKVINEGYE